MTRISPTKYVEFKTPFGGVNFRGQRTHLAISVYYHEGGENWFDGTLTSNAIRVSLSPVAMERGFVSRLISADRHESGFFFEVLPCSRYNKKKVEKVFDIVSSMCDEITRLYEEKQYQSAIAMISAKVKKELA